jgi:capsid protein
MSSKGDAFSETYIESLRQDIARWKAELSTLDVGGEVRGQYLQTSELRAWIEAGEEIFARYERNRGARK